MVGLNLARKPVDDVAIPMSIERARGAAERASSLTQQLLMFALRNAAPVA